MPTIADITARVAQIAHWSGASIEGEIGVLGSLESGAAAKEDGSGAEGTLDRNQLLTDPGSGGGPSSWRPGVDALAIACGTSHGAYKFTRQPDGDILSIDQIEAIHRRVPDTHLVMHGSSSVPQYLQDLINANGGEMPQTWGVPVAEIERGIRYGVRKVNIDTDCRMAMSGAMRRYALQHPDVFDPRKFILAAMDELETLVRDRVRTVRNGRARPRDQAAAPGGNGAALFRRRARSAGGSVMSRALFIGRSVVDITALVEVFPDADSKVKALANDVFAGGSALNAAVVFAFLGGDVTLATSLGAPGVFRDLAAEDLATLWRQGARYLRGSTLFHSTVDGRFDRQYGRAHDRQWRGRRVRPVQGRARSRFRRLRPDRTRSV